MSQVRKYRLRGAAAVAAAAVAAGVAGCGAGAPSAQSAPAPSAAASTSSAVKWANSVLAQSASAPIVYHGPTSAPPFPANKTIAIVVTSADVADESSVRSWKALQAATKAVGWKAVEIADANLNDSFLQAVQEHVSGIFTWGADETTTEGIDAAKKAGIPIIAGYTGMIPWATKLFTHVIDQKYPQQGIDSAASVVALTNGTAKIGIFTTTPDPQYPSSLDITLNSFKQALKQHGGGQIVASTYFNLGDLATPSVLAQQAVAFLQSHPSVNVLWTSFAQPAEDIDEAIIAAGLSKRVKLFTFEGSSLNLSYIRKGQLVASDVAAPLEWMSYSVVDNFNRIFNHKPTLDENLPIKVLTKSNLPPAGQSWTGEINYAGDYLKAWGVG